MKHSFFKVDVAPGLRALASVCHIVLVLLVCPAAYADGMEPDNSTQDMDRPAGNLRVVGAYLYSLDGHLVTALSNGKVLAHGIASVGFPPNFRVQQRTMTLRTRDQHSAVGGDTWDPLIWDPQQQGWKSIEQPPECRQGKPFLHTATVLPGPKILFSGGLCDEAMLANDPSPDPEYKKMSLWNGETEKWEPAPELEHGRVFHTASQLPDWSVLIVGGESDPALSTEGEPVLSSVELYANGKVVQMMSLHEARANHTATVGAHGEVLVAGGYDASGLALASVEIWNPVSREWTKVTPMHTPRYSHSATLLEDGRVLVAGGMGLDGKPLQSVEIWNPATGEWIQSSSLPRPLRGHGAILLDDGNLLLAGGQHKSGWQVDTWAWLWEKSSETWRPAGRSKPPAGDADLVYTPTFAKNHDGSVHIFTHKAIMQWRNGALPPASVPPQWNSHRPALAVLDDGRVMAIGKIPQPGLSNNHFAHIWNPRNDTWSAAGQLANNYGGETRALQLPSGAVIHLGISPQNHLQCELWTSDDDSWTSCGDTQLKYVGEAIGLSLLDDGRAIAITSQAEAHIFDEHTLMWKLAVQKWSNKGLLKGAPVWQDEPFDILIDENNREFDISAVAARYLEEASNPPPMLWDPANKRWAYVLERGTMGQKAKMLPDGCALSPYALSSLYRSNSFSLFQASTGQTRDLFNPGTGINSSYLSMEVLKDGTVVVAGTPEAADVTFFHRKASCAGWAAAEDDWALMPGVKAKQVVAPISANLSPAKAASSSMLNRFMGNRWLVLAVIGPIVLYTLLRFLILPLARNGIGRVLPGNAAKDLDRPVSKGTTSIMRFMVYGVLLVIGVPAFLPHMNILYAKIAEDCSVTACLNPDNGLLRSVPSLEKDGAQPTAPCEYVGRWQAIGQNLHKEHYILKDDGTYSTQLSAGADPHVFTGHWMVQGDKMVWRHRVADFSELDINHIASHGETSFELIEQNGWHTRFNLIERTSSKRCGKPESVVMDDGH